jgi:hypothetical protein
VLPEPHVQGCSQTSDPLNFDSASRFTAYFVAECVA